MQSLVWISETKSSCALVVSTRQAIRSFLASMAERTVRSFVSTIGQAGNYLYESSQRVVSTRKGGPAWAATSGNEILCDEFIVHPRKWIQTG